MNGRDGTGSQKLITLYSEFFSSPGRDLSVIIEQEMYPYALNISLFLDKRKRMAAK